MVGLQRLVRRALLARLKADAGVLAFVPATSINPAGEAVWPFIKVRAPLTLPFRAACVNGGNVSFDIHAFARDRESAGVAVETSEDHASRIGAAIETALAPNRIALEGGATARIALTDIRLLEDDEPNAHHWFAQVNARVLAE